jgi:hypothetical protein
MWGRSSAGRALEWHSRGRRFDPDRLHQIFAEQKFGAPSLVEGLLPLSTSTRGEPPLAHGEPLTKGIICSRVEWRSSVLRLHAFLR